MANDKYTCFRDLAASEERGGDFDIDSRRKDGSSVVVIAPHGGTIEPRTDEIAMDIAGNDFSLYCFNALKKNSGLHIASHLFDEPTCEELIGAHQHVVSIHGWGASGERGCVGGRDIELIAALKKHLNAEGLQIVDAEGALAGTHPKNIANRGSSRRGVQFELTMGFRKNSAMVERFVTSVRTVLLEVR